jgi:putative DNA primase/helicase
MWLNFEDVLAQLQAFGLDVTQSDIVIGQRRRCRHKDGGKEKRGWYQLYELAKDDGSGTLIVGSYGAFWGAENVVQKIELPKADRKAMTQEQMAALRARIAEDKKRAEAEQRKRNESAAHRARAGWSKCLPVGDSDYLKRKGVEGFGVRFSERGNMVIPMLDTNGQIHGLQVIYAEKKNGRDKDFWPAGLAKKGHFFLIGGIPDKVLLIAEGYATAASLHMATGHPVAVAFDAGNLMPVAQALHGRYRRTRVLVCADDDYLTEGNPGVSHAKNAALAVNGSVVIPAFEADRPTDHKGPTDFNDLHIVEGLQAVRSQIEAHLAGLEWDVSATSAPAGALSQGGGESGRNEAVSIMPLDDLVARFIKLDDDSGESIFDTWTNKVVHQRKMVAMLPAGVRSDDIKRHPVWLSRAYYLDQVGFDPSGKDQHIKLNTWRGWPMKPAKGNCEQLLDLIRYLCGAEEDSEASYNFLIKWMAFPLQNPGAKMQSAIIMHGPQGTGKSMVFKTLAKIYGYKGNPYFNYSIVLDQKALQSNFNPDWDSKLFVLAEEVVSNSDKWQLKNELKELITGETIRIEGKFANAVHQKNQMNMAFLSNEGQPIPLDVGDRRHLVIYTPPPLSKETYQEVSDEIHAGGIEAFYDYLLNVDLTGFNEGSKPPMTEAKQRLIDLSAGSELRFVAEWLEGDLGYPACPCQSPDLYAAYRSYCQKNGESRPRTAAQFFSQLGHYGFTKKKARVYERPTDTAATTKNIVFPPDKECVLVAGKTIKAETLPINGNETDVAWLTRCCKTFNESVQDAANYAERGGV